MYHTSAKYTHPDETRLKLYWTKSQSESRSLSTTSLESAPVYWDLANYFQVSCTILGGKKLDQQLLVILTYLKKLLGLVRTADPAMRLFLPTEDGDLNLSLPSTLYRN